jgi:hypothetical protein
MVAQLSDVGELVEEAGECWVVEEEDGAAPG